jgi:flagellar motor switch protein FliM
MPDDILSADELDALLATVEEENSGARQREKRITDYDFIRPNKLSGDQIRSLQRMHETISQNMTMILSTYLRVNLEVNLISLGQLTFDVFRNSLSNPTVINVLSMNPILERSLLTMDIKLAFSLVDRMLGGPGKALEKIRALTPLEQSLLDNIISRIIERIRDGWGQLLEFEPIIEAREMDPQFVQVIPSSEMVLVTTFTLQAPGELETGEICFCMPFISLDPVLPKLGYNFQFSQTQREQSDEQRLHIDRVINETTLPLTVNLGNVDLSIGDILSLEEGDVIVLDQLHSQPLSTNLRGHAKISGRAGRVGRHYGLVIEEVAPDGFGDSHVPPTQRGGLLAESAAGSVGESHG